MTITLAPDIAATETGDETVLLDERRGRYFKLNPTGALILRALLDGRDAGQAVALLREQFGIEEQRARADVSDLIEALRTAKLIRQ